MEPIIYIPRTKILSPDLKYSPMVVSIYQNYIPVVAAMWGTVLELEGNKILKYPNVNTDVGNKRIIFCGRRTEYLFISQNDANLYKNDVISAGMLYHPGTTGEEGYIAETALNLSYARTTGDLLPLVCLVIRPDKLWEIREGNTSKKLSFLNAKDFVILVDKEFRKRQHSYLWRNYNRIFKRMEANNAIEILHNVDIMELCYKPIPLTDYPSISEAVDRVETMTAEFSEIVNPTEIYYEDADIEIIDDTEIRVIDDTIPRTHAETVRHTDYSRAELEENLDNWVSHMQQQLVDLERRAHNDRVLDR
jgi:hypothetical protein